MIKCYKKMAAPFIGLLAIIFLCYSCTGLSNHKYIAAEDTIAKEKITIDMSVKRATVHSISDFLVHNDIVALAGVVKSAGYTTEIFQDKYILLKGKAMPHPIFY